MAPEPIAFLQRLAAEGDIVPFVLAGHRAFLVNHPDYVEDVLVSSASRFSKPPRVRHQTRLLGTGLLTAEGELHRQRRRVVQAAFAPSRMRGYSQTMAECAERLQGGWRDGAIVDMASEMRKLALEVIGRILFGVDLAPRATEIGRAVAAASAVDPLLSFLAPARHLKPAAELLRSVVDSLIDQHVADGGDGDDMLSVLRRADGADGSPTTDQLRDDVLTLFVAGHDTIANGLVWTWHLLSEHQEASRRLDEELRVVLGRHPPAFDHVRNLSYASWVLAESLRLYPPAWILTRRARVPHEIGGVPIPPGAIVLVSQYLLHRDPRFFPEPLAFWPHRWAALQTPARPGFAYFPFGAGPRGCIGQALGTLEGVLTVAGIARHWRCRSLAPLEVDARATLRPRGPAPMQIEQKSGLPRARHG